LHILERIGYEAEQLLQVILKCFKGEAASGGIYRREKTCFFRRELCTGQKVSRPWKIMVIDMDKIKSSTHFFWRFLPLAGLIIWGALAVTNNLWYDEGYSASMISHTWSELIQITAADDHSPFYYILLKLFYHLFGGGKRFFSLKMMSVLFMMGYLLLGKYYVKKLFGEKISLYFMLFSLLMPIMAVQAANVRMYTAALFFMTLTGLSAYDIFIAPARKKWIVFCLAGLCCVYCHTFAMIQTLILYIFFFGAILYKKQYQKLKGFFISGFVVAAAYLPWLAVTYRQMRLRIAEAGAGAQIPDIDTLIDYCKEWFSALETPITLVMYLGMALAVFLGYYAVDWMRSHHNYVPGMGVAAIGLTALSGALISYYISPCFLGRYAFPGFGALALMYAVGMDNIKPRAIRTGILVVALVCFLLQYRSELRLEYDKGLKTYQAFVEENVGESDAIMGSSSHTIFLNVYYPQLQYFIYGNMPDKMPFQNTEAFQDWEQLEEVEGRLWYICFQGDSPYLLGERYAYEEVLSFHYMYYNFVIYQLFPL